MNQLSVNLQHSIATLAAKGWSSRGAPVSPGAGFKPAIVPTGSKAGRASQCEPSSAIIEAGLLAGLSGQRIYQDLITDHQFTGGYDSVKRFDTLS